MDEHYDRICYASFALRGDTSEGSVAARAIVRLAKNSLGPPLMQQRTVLSVEEAQALFDLFEMQVLLDRALDVSGPDAD